MKLGFAILSLCLAAGAASAQDQREMNREAAASFDKADAELNRIYEQVLRKTPKETRSLLVESEKAWIKYRDLDCDFQTSANLGGSVHPMIHRYCAEERTRDRIKQLRYYLTCAEEQGDLSCPTG